MKTNIEKNFEIEQPIDIVWRSLSNPEEIVTCVPGASITEKIDENNYKGAVVTKFGPIKAAYAGDIGIVEMDNDNYTMKLKGRGLDSKGKGSADMIMNGALKEDGGVTHVKFSMEITIVGMLAQFGSRLINDVSDQLLNQFVTNFKNKLASEVPTETPITTSSGEATTVVESAIESATGAIEHAAESIADSGKEIVDNVKEAVSNVDPKQSPEPDNALNAFSLVGTIIKSILGGIVDAIKGLFGGRK